MCGIVGMVGAAKDPALSFNLITNLMRETQRRGRDASGHYLVNLESNCEMFKLPIPTERYVTLNPWQRISNGTMALIGHARWTTHGVAKNNENNHPFVTNTGNLALVHNGVVKDYTRHKSNYSLQTQCDSEILLHTISKQKNVLEGIKEVFKLFGEGGDFACEVIYRNPKTGIAKFFIFREPGRPAYFIDCREQLGQYFFCSDDDIWKDAVQKSGMIELLKGIKPVMIPTYEIWAIDSSTLEIKKTTVENIVKRTATTTYSSSGTGYHGSTWNNGTSYAGSTSTTPSVNTNRSLSSLGDDPKLLEKLGPGWTKTKNELGQLVLTFDDEKVKLEEEATKHVADIRAGLDDPEKRFPGWEDEARSLGLLEDQNIEEALAGIDHTDLV